MGFHHRKMMFSFQPEKGLHLIFPTFQIYPPPPPPPPPPPSPSSQEYFSLLVSTLICILGSVLLFLILIVGLYICIPQSRRNPTVTIVPRVTNQRENEEEEEEDEEERGHHVWRITTVGLQRSVIDSITVIGFKKGEGIIEGTDCSVCLNEFEEDESLRLLPKCNHAFHINCIDTWLLSHSNCPLCRAPILLTESPRQESETNHQPQESRSNIEEQESSRSRSLSRVQSDLANHCDSLRRIETVRRSFSIGGSSTPKANNGEDDDIASRSRRRFYSSFNATANFFSSSRSSRNQDTTLPIQAPSTS